MRRSILLLALILAGRPPPLGAQEHLLELIPVRELADAGLEKVISRHIAQLNDGGPEARGEAREMLRRTSWRAAVPLLQREIRPGKNRNKTVGALLAVDGIGGEEAVLLLRRVLLDDGYRARERLAAGLVLAKAGERAAARFLGAAMRQTSQKDRVRIGLALAAARLGDRSLVAPLRRLAPRPGRPTPLGAAVGLALTELGAPDAAAWIRPLGRSGSPRIRRAACLAAARLEDPASLGMLADLLRLENNDPGTAVCAVVALGIRRPEGVRAQLIKALASSEDLVREHAAVALGWYPDQRVTQVLKAAYAREREASVRSAVVRALERHGDPSLLATALADASPEVRVAAMVLAARVDRERAIHAIDDQLARETDSGVIATGLSVRLVVSERPLPADHRLRRGSAAVRVLRRPLWRDLDRYRNEPGAPAWRWARALAASERGASEPGRVRARLLNALMLELLDLKGEFEMPERRVIANRSARPSVVIGAGRGRSSTNFDPIEEDLKVWLRRRPFFPE